MKMIKPYAILTLLLSVILAVVVCIGVMVYADLNSRPVVEKYEMPTPTRTQINATVARLIGSGRSEELYAFYASEVGDPTRAWLYTASALVQGAPVNLVISQAWWEGGRVGKIDGPNRNGSFDFEPMGLNSETYSQFTAAELRRLEVNIPTGIAHLMGEKEKWGVSLEAALASYNHGSPSGLDYHQIDYVTAIIRHEVELDRRFACRFDDVMRWDVR
jgi:hypothetical protein